MTAANDLPPRLHQPQVLELAGYSRATLRARRKAKRMPDPIDRGPHGGIYDRDAVLKALGIAQDAAPDTADAWDFEPGAINEYLARPVCGAKAPRGRQRSRLLPGSGSPPPLRLASDNTDAAGRGSAGHR